MATYNNSVTVKFDTAENGNAGAGASITVYLTGTTTKANITHSGTPSDGNPMFADANGNYSFEVVSGVYDIVINEGNLSEQRLNETSIGTFAFTDIPQTITAPYTFQVPSINDNGIHISTRFVETVDGDNSGFSINVNGSYLLNEFDRSNNNTGTSTTRVTTEAGAEARITKRLTVDDWSALGNVTFNGAFTTFNAPNEAVFNNGAVFNSGGFGVFFESEVKTRTGLQIIWDGQSATSFGTLSASATGELLWDGFKTVAFVDFPQTITAPYTFNTPPNLNSGTHWNGVFFDEVANPYGGYVLQANGVRGLNTFDLSSSNTVGTETDTGSSRAGVEAMMTRKAIDDNYLTDIDAGEGIEIDKTVTREPVISVTNTFNGDANEVLADGFAIDPFSLGVEAVINFPTFLSGMPSSITGSGTFRVENLTTGIVVKTGITIADLNSSISTKSGRRLTALRIGSLVTTNTVGDRYILVSEVNGASITIS